MKGFVLTLLLLFAVYQLKGQAGWSWQRQSKVSVLFGIGSSSYYGELKESDFGIDLSGAFTAGVSYRYTDYISLRGELTYYRISGADVDNGPESSLANRNLSFEANNFELSAQAVFNLSPEDIGYFEKPIINPIAFIGLGITTQSAKAEINGQKFGLRPLQTEGVSYSPIAVVIPFGVGAKFNVGRNINIGIEAGYRYTFTDYLDDVSSVYVDNASFTDPIARTLADRRPEIGLPLKQEGDKRGNPDVSDYYFIIGLKAEYNLVSAPNSTRGFSFKSRKYYTDKKAKRFRKKMKRQTNKRRKRRK
ncbi:MAG: DUF6089 family protein [Bacteroidetes bacterium]|nr:DUF6089 family protein [Bacteroidota bacterium]